MKLIILENFCSWGLHFIGDTTYTAKFIVNILVIFYFMHRIIPSKYLYFALKDRKLRKKKNGFNNVAVEIQYFSSTTMFLKFCLHDVWKKKRRCNCYTRNSYCLITSCFLWHYILLRSFNLLCNFSSFMHAYTFYFVLQPFKFGKKGVF